MTAPNHLKRQAFARRLFRLMIGKGWLHSELARRAGLRRDTTSNYLHGTVLATQANAEKLAKALNVTVEELLPSDLVAEETADASVDARLDKLARRVEALEREVRELRER